MNIAYTTKRSINNSIDRQYVNCSFNLPVEFSFKVFFTQGTSVDAHYYIIIRAHSYSGLRVFSVHPSIVNTRPYEHWLGPKI